LVISALLVTYLFYVLILSSFFRRQSHHLTRKTKSESEFRRRAPTLATSRSFRGARIASLIGHVSGAGKKAVPVVGGEAAFRGETKRLADGRGASDRRHIDMFGQAPLQ
jgi:hypothetical protein